MKTILYIHGFNGNPKGGTFDGIVNYYKNKKNCRVISFPFPALHTDVKETQTQIENYVKKYHVQTLIGASLGGFYVLSCQKPLEKIVINPCMRPSIEIPLLKDRESGLPIEIDDSVLKTWQEMEKYEFPFKYRNAFGIFGTDDVTFHYDENHNYEPLLARSYLRYDNGKTTIMVNGKHSLESESIYKGLEAAEKYFEEQKKNQPKKSLFADLKYFFSDLQWRFSWQFWSDVSESENYFCDTEGNIILDESSFQHHPARHFLMGLKYEIRHWDECKLTGSIFDDGTYDLVEINKRCRKYGIEPSPSIQSFDGETYHTYTDPSVKVRKNRKGRTKYE